MRNSGTPCQAEFACVGGPHIDKLNQLLSRKGGTKRAEHELEGDDHNWRHVEVGGLADAALLAAGHVARDQACRAETCKVVHVYCE
jgi:hypothetical protein